VVLREQALQRWDTGDLEGAVHALSLAFQLFPDARFAYNIAQLERKRGRCDEARAQYQRYLKLDPAGAWVNDARAHLAELTSCPPAARGCRRMIPSWSLDRGCQRRRQRRCLWNGPRARWTPRA
jgi:hypothetical protein